MEKVLFFLDYANINSLANRYGGMNFRALAEYIGEDRNLVDSYAYVPVDPRALGVRDREIEQLWQAGYQVTAKTGTITGDTYKCNMDVEITIDVLAAAYTIRPDIIVLGSGDGDFLPLIAKLRLLGIRVEVAAFKENISRKTTRQCSGFIDLGRVFDEEQEHEAAPNFPVEEHPEDSTPEGVPPVEEMQRAYSHDNSLPG